MNARLWIFGGSVAIVGVLAAGWFLGVQPLLAQASANDTERSSVEQVNAQQQARLSELAALSDSLPEMQEQLAALDAALPADSGMGDFVGELARLSGDAKVTVTSLIAGDSQLIADAAAAAGVGAAPAAPVEGADATSTESATAAPVATAPTAADGLVTLPVTLTASGSLDGINAFLEGVQNSGRLISIATAVIASDGAGGVTLTLTGAAYVQSAAA